ncbi:MAG: nitrate reductase cytochrome c-type subunit [Bacillus sp. (in: Bacteria)]|nr:nitrate reductase cytochrome c-type subunit [Bacillus sp. (in: firmicutes)]
MREKGILYIVAFMLVLSIAIGTTELQNSLGASRKAVSPEGGIVQLSEKGRPNAETIVLINVPPMQPVTHIDRWNPLLHQDSCLACHNKPDTGAPTPPDDHYYENDTLGKVSRDNCVQCHAQQNETKTKTAFNN